MKHITLLGLAAACTCTPAFSDWIQIGVPANSSQTLSTTGQSLNFTDPGRPGTGTFTLTGTSGTAGGAVIGRDFGFYPTGFFSNFPANGLNPTDADQFVVGTVSGCSGTAFCNVSGVWDFTGIGGGFLPAGSDFVISDLDVFESLSSLNATAFAPISGDVSWLQFIGQFDGDGSATSIGTNPTLSSHYATFSTSGSGMLTYTFTSPSINTDVPVLHFRTTVDISTISFDGGTQFGNRGYGFAIQSTDTPEPSTWGMASVAALAFVALARRRPGSMS
ncbi:MAG: hypothetical protein JNL62_15770 [Bryobacterales bacterium]|nr:hypothetical protein [Bryobacterales bacterium]